MKKYHPNYPVAQIKKGRSTLGAEQAALVFFRRVMEVHDLHQLDHDPNTTPSQTLSDHNPILISSRSGMSNLLLSQESTQPPPIGHEHRPMPQPELKTAPSLEQPPEQPLDLNLEPNLEPNPSFTPAIQGGEHSESNSKTQPCELNDFILQETQPPRKKRKSVESGISPVPAPVYLITNRKLRHHKGGLNLKKCQEFLSSHSLPACCSECSKRGMKSKFPKI
jgi:hypothetical protein